MTEIIAEIGLQHDGSLREALGYVSECARRGVDVVKFQCHLADRNLSFRPGTEHHFPQDESRFHYWQRTGFTQREWKRIKQECDDCGVEFLCTPFSLAAAELLNPMLKRWKIGSGNVQDAELLSFVRKTGKPIIYSNGKRLPVHYELHEAGTLEMACISEYPETKEDQQRLLVRYMELLSEVRYSPRWGWSSHTGCTADSIAAIEAGATAVEVHVCWHSGQRGPDVKSAIEVNALPELVDAARTQGRTHEARISAVG